MILLRTVYRIKLLEFIYSKSKSFVFRQLEEIFKEISKTCNFTDHKIS